MSNETEARIVALERSVRTHRRAALVLGGVLAGACMLALSDNDQEVIGFAADQGNFYRLVHRGKVEVLEFKNGKRDWTLIRD